MRLDQGVLLYRLLDIGLDLFFSIGADEGQRLGHGEWVVLFGGKKGGFVDLRRF